MRDYIRGYRDGPLHLPMAQVVLVTCPNLDEFHEGMRITYAIFGKGAIIDDPDMGDILAIREAWDNAPIEFLFLPCVVCRKKGVLGVSAFTNPYL